MTTSDAVVEAHAPDRPPDAPVLDRNPRLALVVFVVVEAAAFLLYLWAGRRRWFFDDEWMFLVEVSGGDVDWLAPHNDHWTTLPKLIYWALFSVVGLDSYRPYQLVTIVLHLVSAALLRAVMRRAGVGPWIATVAAGVFVLFGTGDLNILRAFQVTFTAALAFGLAQLLLVNHDGGIDRRDWFALLFGLAALTCSAIGLAMVAAAVSTAWIRRGWRAGLCQLVPLGAIFGAWYVVQVGGRGEQAGATVGQVVSFTAMAMRATFEGLGQSGIVAIALVAIALVGLSLAWRHLGDAEVRHRAAGPLGLLVGAVIVLVLTGWARGDRAAEFATKSRYLHILAALCLPALAVAADALSRRSRALAAVVVVVLLAGVPGNVAISWNQRGIGRTDPNQRAFFTAFAVVPAADEARGWEHPDLHSANAVTVDWLRDLVHRGKLTPPETIDPDVAAEATFRLSLQQRGRPASLEHCEPLTRGVDRRLAQGEQFGFSGTIRVLDRTRPRSAETLYVAPERGALLQVLRGPLDVRIRPKPLGPRPKLCPTEPAR